MNMKHIVPTVTKHICPIYLRNQEMMQVSCLKEQEFLLAYLLLKVHVTQPENTNQFMTVHHVENKSLNNIHGHLSHQK